MGHLYIEVECLIHFIHIFSTNKKFSRHLIFQLKNAAFRNNIHAGNCCWYTSLLLGVFNYKIIGQKHSWKKEKCLIYANYPIKMDSQNLFQIQAFNSKLLKTSWFTVWAILSYYHNDPKFLNRQVLANSADPAQTAPIRVYTVCHSVCIFWANYSVVKRYCSNFRIITAIFRVSKFLC